MIVKMASVLVIPMSYIKIMVCWSFLIIQVRFASGASNGVGTTETMVGISNDLDWKMRVADHVCGIIACEGWCDCSRATSQVTLGNETVATTDACTPTPQPNRPGFSVFTDCANDIDRICFQWKPLGPFTNPSMECLPQQVLLACLKRINTSSSDLLWQVCLESTSDQCIDAVDLCSNSSHDVLPRDQCNLCERNEDNDGDNFTPKIPGDHVGTSLPGNTAGAGHSDIPNKIGTTGGRRMTFIIGVCVGIGGAIGVGIFCVCVFYIHRKLNRNAEQLQGSQSNHYSTVEHPLRARVNGEDRPNSAGQVAGNNLRKKTVKQTPPKDTNKGSHVGPYTEYYSDRAKSCYAELQNVASNSALASRDKRLSDGHAFNIFSEYQEPDLTLPPNIPGSFLFEDSSLAPSPSFNSFKLAGQYMDPQDVRRGEEHKGRLIKQNTKKSEASSCKISGTLYSELVQTLNRKKAMSDVEPSPQEVESENPYAEVGEFNVNPIAHLQQTDRQRSNSHPTDLSILDYRTYEEIKPHIRRNREQWDSNDDRVCDSGGNPQYFVLEDSILNPEPQRQYFELEQFCDDRDSEGHAYFTLEKPSSLPLDKKKKHHRLSDHAILYNYEEQSATIYDSDNSNQRASGAFQISHIPDSGDSNGSNSVSTKAHAYLQLERSEPGDSGTKRSVGPGIQELMGDSAEVISVRDGTLTFYPGGRKRASTQSLEEQAYDKLNRSARSSRRNVLINTTEAPINGPYGVL